MNKTFYSGDWYMTISNEPPMTNSGKTYCKFDLIKNRNFFWGCPVNQFGSIEEVLNELKRWKEISEAPEYNCIKEVYADRTIMEDYFIDILSAELGTTRMK